ncbi:hypothetical protein GCM10023152_11830 [Agromyces bauzanensis]|uniref:Uncharacterized protein n=1 Tax=Agromyces bauzanensis TaxID=1308924 RepID=A0A917UM28_9MICO|nr:hypothetical protein GCM10011372_01100 [Agromyces bauzanensis]
MTPSHPTRSPALGVDPSVGAQASSVSQSGPLRPGAPLIRGIAPFVATTLGPRFSAAKGVDDGMAAR